ncbi:MAG: nucleotidyltransferase [Bacteroidales bacterium]|nr:nucleotidyltransferase [Bacteroidales bacterium]
MKPTLVVLAAGMGSRYGGLKQMDGLGPNNETIIDYSIYDAVRAGFGKVVYIVREYFKEQFQDTVKKKYSSVRCIDGSPLEFQFVTQELDKIPVGYVVNPERVKPWGTAHALLMAAEAVGEPFAVINGDDYYGRDSFQILADWLRQRENSTGEYCIVGFKLENTLSESGGVSRGICSYDKDNNLIDVVEHHMIAREADGEIRGDNSVTLEHVLLNGSDLCSMNMWGFTPDYFEKSAVIFDSFLAAHSNELKSEFYIPYAVDQMIKKGGDKCTVLCTPSRWFGVTYQQDRPGVVAKFEQLVKDGIYPSPLYE